MTMGRRPGWSRGRGGPSQFTRYGIDPPAIRSLANTRFAARDLRFAALCIAAKLARIRKLSHYKTSPEVPKASSNQLEESGTILNSAGGYYEYCQLRGFPCCRFFGWITERRSR